MRVAVVGLGHIGLPLAVQYASRGHDVLGIDIDRRIVETLNAGSSAFLLFLLSLGALLSLALAMHGSFHFTE